MSHNLPNELSVTIEDFIDKICSLQDIQPERFMIMYRDIYDYATSSARQILGGKLYHHIEICLQTRLENICQSVDDMTDADVLRLYEMHWKKYKRMCRYLNSACHYLNRHWIRREYDSGRRDVYEIGVLCQRIWGNVFFKPLFLLITRTCLNLIKTNRVNRSSIDAESIKNILQLYLDQEFIEKMKVLMNNDPAIPSINDIYTEYFEIQFLQEAEDFYRQQRIPSVESKSSIIEYLIPVAEYFDQEINLAKSYLPESKSTLQMLIDKLGEILIPDKNLDIITNEVKRFISTENNHDLGLLYEPISRIPKLKNEIVKFIGDYIYEKGNECISSIATSDVELYIETIYRFHQKYFPLVQETVNTDCALMTSFNKACRKFMNNNVLTQTFGDTIRLPERLAHHCHILLKKRTKGVEEMNLEEKFEQIMILFTYLNDKDVFLKCYQKLLAKRLVHQLSISDDSEELIISKLKQICSCEYTSKLERMYNDIVLSKTLTDKYKLFWKDHHLVGIVDFSVIVLNSNLWSYSVPSNIILPIELKPTFDSFIDCYNQFHTGRKLTWLYQHSNGELQINFTGQKYTLQVSMYQMVVLLLFNTSDNWTVERIQDETQIKFELLVQILYSLLKRQILVCTEINQVFEETDIKVNHSIQLTNNFTSKKRRININEPLKSVVQKDVKDLDETIDEDRQMPIQATIVRIMKGQQMLKDNLLIDEVIQQMSIYFQPTIPLIKKCIDILIEKEYLERDSNEQGRLRYLA